MKSRFCACLLAVSILFSLFGPVFAHGQGAETAATEISSIDLITASTGFGPLKRLFDNKTATPVAAEASTSLTLEYETGIGSLYLIFAKAYGCYTVTSNDTGASITAGTDPFIHEFLDLAAAFGTAPKSVTITFSNGPVELTELDIYTAGEVPESVQKWSLPAEGEADLVLFATHSDDDQLFFAGLIPYYVLERGYQVQVVYLTDHHNTAPFRVHEVLNGLWAVGVRCYPVLGKFDDFGDANTLEQGFQKFKQRGSSREELTAFVVEQLRRFKPFVAVGHDFNGEYGHAQHRVYAQLLADAIRSAMTRPSIQNLQINTVSGTFPKPTSICTTKTAFP